MVDFTFATFAFLAGIVAFFSPCSAALLPGYISYYLSKGEKTKLTFLQALFKGIKFGFFTILGFLTVFGTAGLLVIILGQVVKKFIPWIAIIFGTGLILIGIGMLFGKHFSVNLNFLMQKREAPGLYIFGVTYAVAALSCVFPIFLTIALQVLVENNLLEAVIPLIFYIAGISLVMLITTITTIFARDLISRKINKILPYINYFSALILIFAGAYIIYYQYFILK